MRSPTTDVASYQSSQLAHPSYFSNPALMDDSNLQSLHVDANFTFHSHRGSQEASRTIPFSASLPRLFHPTSTPTHSYICFTLSIYLILAPLPMNRLTFVQYWILCQSKRFQQRIRGTEIKDQLWERARGASSFAWLYSLVIFIEWMAALNVLMLVRRQLFLLERFLLFCPLCNFTLLFYRSTLSLIVMSSVDTTLLLSLN